VWGGIKYELVVSVQGHARNPAEVELKGKTLQVVEGPGAGQAATIAAYDPETKAYYLNVIGDNWTVIPRFDSRYDITTRMSEVLSVNGSKTYNNDYLSTAPVTDSWSIVLTRRPGQDVIVNVVPAATRTYNSSEAFNADAAFGENKAKQVRVATDRALIQLGGTPAAGEYWVLTLTGTGTTLSVDAFIDAVFQKLGDGVIDTAERDALRLTNSDAFVYSGGSSDLTTVAAGLKSAIDGFPTAGYSATMTPGLAVDLAVGLGTSGNPVPGEAWKLTVDGVLFSYAAVVGNDLAAVATKMAALINANGTGFKASADGGKLLVLKPGASAAFFAKLQVAAGGEIDILAQAPQLLVTGGSAFYAEMSIGIDTNPNAGSGAANVKVRPATEPVGHLTLATA
jgi:hypothetical protein